MTQANRPEPLAALVQQYRNSLKTHSRTISEKWRRLTHLSWDKKGLSELHEIAHKLSGSGTTFGFPKITETARALETLIAPLLEADEQLDAERRMAINDRVTALLHTIDEATTAPVATVDAHVPQQALNKIAIALIEDDPLVAETISLWLEESGHTVDRFATPDEFTKAALEHHFDLLILDISFPDAPLGGITWLEASKPHLGNHLPVLMVSARTDLQARVRALRAGAAGYMIKPIDFPSLQDQINTLLSRHRDNQYKVLLVDDDVTLCEHYRNALEKQGFTVSTLSQPLAILDVMDRYTPDIIVLDYQMPGINGIEVARVLRQEPRYMETPILFLTANANEVSQKPLSGVVGNAILNKPLSADALALNIRRQLQQARATASRLHMTLIRHTPAGLKTRNYFFTEFESFMAARIKAATTPPPELLLHLAINNTPAIKQQFGLAGSAKIDQAIESFLSNYPPIAGNGCSIGDFSYLVRFRVESYQHAEAAVAQLLDTLANTSFTELPIDELNFAIGGIALSNAIKTAESAVDKAEQLYLEALTLIPASKLLIPASPQDAQKAIQSAINSALQQQRFRLNFQPIVNLGSDSPLYEVLVRLIDEEGTEYLPDQFFEQLKAMYGNDLTTLDRWVIEHVFDEIVRLGGTAAESTRVIIKLSPQPENLKTILFYIANALQNSRIRHGRRIFFALPMGFVTRNPDVVTTFIHGLHELNCGIMVEHYTDSAAPEESFRHIPFPDLIKLDRSWNNTILVSDSARANLKRIMEFMGENGRIVASTVEDRATFSAYWEHGIRDFQGYFFQRPASTMIQDVIESQVPRFV